VARVKIVHHTRQPVSGTFDRKRTRKIVARERMVYRVVAQLAHNVHHAMGLVGVAPQRWMPGQIVGCTNWTTRLAAHLAADVDHATLAARPS
jgi:hypothetical protein